MRKKCDHQLWRTRYSAGLKSGCSYLRSKRNSFPRRCLAALSLQRVAGLSTCGQLSQLRDTKLGFAAGSKAQAAGGDESGIQSWMEAKQEASSAPFFVSCLLFHPFFVLSVILCVCLANRTHIQRCQGCLYTSNLCRTINMEVLAFWGKYSCERHMDEVN